MARKKSKTPGRLRIENRRARYNYEILENIEAGIVLTGTEVKSLRQGLGSIAEAYARPRDGEMYLIDCHIPEYLQAGPNNHEPKRERKLLLHRREIVRLSKEMNQAGMTVVALTVFFNDRGMAKVDLGLARGKKLHDKRDSIKEKDWQRRKQRILNKWR